MAEEICRAFEETLVQSISGCCCASADASAAAVYDERVTRQCDCCRPNAAEKSFRASAAADANDRDVVDAAAAADAAVSDDALRTVAEQLVTLGGAGGDGCESDESRVGQEMLR